MVPSFLSTPSARRATRSCSICRMQRQISIHALREEGDSVRPAPLSNLCYFYPRPPRGGRLLESEIPTSIRLFLSTPSARRATRRQDAERKGYEHFYPRPPRGGRQKARSYAVMTYGISIHALREEGDPASPPTLLPSSYFYPRPPRGGRLPIFTFGLILRLFLSTPSARRATIRPPVPCCPGRYFYPRPPRGGRPARTVSLQFCQIFLSTPSARRATS